MLLAIDIGNSNITLGGFDDEVLLFTARLATDTRLTSDQYAYEIKNILSIYNKHLSDIEDCIIASVVPNVQSSICTALSNICDVVPMMVGPGIKTGLDIKIDNPAQLGADLVAGAVGAVADYTVPCIIIDMGTATTVFCVDENGAFIGGSIGAGVRLTLKALCENTSQLPATDIVAPASVIGKNTSDCMKSGLVFGTAAMIDGLVDRMKNIIGQNASVVATGGLSREIIKYCNNEIIYNENLLLEGLRIIYEKNK
ncbi:MAG: type III pantothenate kinase [Clostridia bacterium]|nr:type III pantothenate kinase [Clostridia bacterium]